MSDRQKPHSPDVMRALKWRHYLRLASGVIAIAIILGILAVSRFG